MAGMMASTLPFLEKIGEDKGLIVGYTTMVLAGLLVYFGIRSYRDNVCGGKLSFGQAFVVGILISLIANCFYVGTWEILYHKFMPDFAEKYSAQMIERAKASGASQQKMDDVKRQAEDFQRSYRNPFYVIGMTFLEVFPPFLVITLISAAILRRKLPTPATQ